MTVNCSHVPTNLTYDCENPWGQNCTSDKGFHFTSLWKYTQSIQKACANDTRLFIPHDGMASPRNASLTQASCEAIAGSDWTYYPAADIWTRLTTWKFPLLQLVATFPRPPLSFWVECFVILHLLGDPIDTTQNLLSKMSTCQLGARYWRAECAKLLKKRDEEDEDRDWKALALVTDAYGEWGEDGQAKLALQQGLFDNPQHKYLIAKAVRQTGRALAADRSTKFLPIIVAQAFFIGTVGIAIFRTASVAGENALSDTVFINVEAHSIGFSALYFWIIPAVFMSSVIGVSQTEAAIPRILRRFQIDVERLNLPNEIRLPNECLDGDEKRIFYGGIYSWQPLTNSSSGPYLTYPNVLPYLIVILGTVAGMAVSAFVPPDGWGCRHIGEILISITWLLSAQANSLLNYLWPLNKDNQSKLFWFTVVKDLLATIATMGGIIATQVGILNRCSCFTQWGRTGLALPEMPGNAEILFKRLTTVYPAITFTSIGIELIVIPLFICFHYRDALRTFLQRDDRKSNAAWLWKISKKHQALGAKLRTTFSRNTFFLSKKNRTGSSVIESGYPSESNEMEHLTQTWSEEPEPMNPETASADRVSVGDEQPEPTPGVGTGSRTSGVDPPSRSGTNMSSESESRRRNTEREAGLTNNQPSMPRARE